jgi:hypothetical protein
MVPKNLLLIPAGLHKEVFIGGHSAVCFVDCSGRGAGIITDVLAVPLHLSKFFPDRDIKLSFWHYSEL